MNILFLQKVDNARGGIANVNLKLMSYFLSMGHRVTVLSIRHGDTWEKINYPEGAETYLINYRETWGCPRLKDFVAHIKSGHFIKGARLLFNRAVYKKKISADYKACQKMIESLAPDIIINSHYEILKGIDDKYLKRTIMHFHTSFDQVLINSSYLKTFKQYADKIYKFVWLSEKTKEAAETHGLKNGLCIYNPLAFTEQRSADMTHKKVVFLGRLSEEKRIHLAIEYFREVVRENGLKEWIFEIYGTGDLEEVVRSAIANDSQIIYKGQTEKVSEVLLDSSIMVLTSSFEGMPLVVLEANECGVPVLVYDFGESSHEVILDGMTGIIVPQDDKDAFKAALLKLFVDEEYRKQLSIHAKQFAKQFSIENIGKQWTDLFEKMEN